MRPLNANGKVEPMPEEIDLIAETRRILPAALFDQLITPYIETPAADFSGIHVVPKRTLRRGRRSAHNEWST